MITIKPIPALVDNYIWLVINTIEKTCLIVDPGEAHPVKEILAAEQLRLTAILITHKHFDHVGGVQELQATYNVPVYGPPLSDVTVCVQGGETISLPALGLIITVMALPGHTPEHLGYLYRGHFFCGDTLFSAGCGRVFENQYHELWSSLQQLNRLPATTLFYCAHEYTRANLAFAHYIEPHNPYLADRIKEVEKLMKFKKASLPTHLEQERMINPFLRLHESGIQHRASQLIGHELTEELDIFMALRHLKDDFTFKT